MLLADNEVDKTVKTLGLDAKDLRDLMEYLDVLLQSLAIAMGKFHETQQEKDLFLRDELYLQLGAHIDDHLFFVDDEIGIVVHALRLVEQVDVSLVGLDTEMAGKISVDRLLGFSSLYFCQRGENGE